MKIVGKQSTLKQGFTLIELVVVIAIISVLSSIVLYNYRDFGDEVMVSNLAYDVGQSIREAQNYGISARAGDTGINFGNAYGVRFGPMELSGASTHYQLFFDQGNVQRYVGGIGLGGVGYTGICPPAGINEDCTKEYTLTGGNKIKQICVVGGGAGGSDLCTSGASAPEYISIMFKRPNPDAIITDKDHDDPLNGLVETRPVRIDITNSSETIMKSVTVTQTGQISIQGRLRSQ